MTVVIAVAVTAAFTAAFATFRARHAGCAVHA
jgi:hypothetical protein